jgi:hypothetical protein
MAEQLDTSKGWCCNGKTWTEHAHEAGGQCCQPQGQQIEDLPEEGQKLARERMAQASS